MTVSTKGVVYDTTTRVEKRLKDPRRNVEVKFAMFLSTSPMSFEKRLITLPSGFAQKKDIGARKARLRKAKAERLRRKAFEPLSPSEAAEYGLSEAELQNCGQR